MSRARAARKPELGEMITMARARFARVTARKARTVADLIRGLTVAEAEQQLAAIHRPSAVPVVSRVLQSAVANAEKNHEMDKKDLPTLIVGEVLVDAGPMLKRFRAAPMGRGVRVRKRMAHVTIKLYAQP